MKRILIYEKMNNGKSKVIRAISVHPSFKGIGRNGQINVQEFKELCEDLEPTYSSFDVIDI